MENQKKVNTKAVCLIAAAVVIVVFSAVYFMFSEKPQDGTKNVSIEVIGADGVGVVYSDVTTDAEYLKGAMEDADGLEFDGYEDKYGFVVTTVGGEYADFTSAYWRTTVNGSDCNYGVDSQPVSDGDKFQIIFTPIA